MYSLQTIKHSEADSETLNRVIAIKQVAWPYPVDSQLRWMRDNLRDDDVHAFLQEDGRDVAYLNIAWVSACINGVNVRCAGVGNVCSKFTGGGYGKSLIIKTEEYFARNNLIGILFCKNALVGFYEKYNWKLIDSKRVTLPHVLEGINTMVFNIDNVDTIEYRDRNF